MGIPKESQINEVGITSSKSAIHMIAFRLGTNLNVRSGAIAEDKQENWETLYYQKLLFWKGFAKKWLTTPTQSGDAPLGRIVIQYEELVRDTEAKLVNIFSSSNLKTKAERIKIREENYNINKHGRIGNTLHKLRADVRGFAHFSKYDKQYYDLLYEACCQSLYAYEANT